MKETKGIQIQLLDENDFKKKERAIRKYFMNSYKELVFKHYYSLRHGLWPGKLVDKNEKTLVYEVELSTDRLFKKVYGPLKLHYTVYEDKGYVLLTDLTPTELLIAGHRYELDTYKGVPIRDKRDIKKIDFVLGMEKFGIGGK